MQKRNILVNGVLTFFTFGLWGLVWLCKTTKEIQKVTGYKKTAGGKTAAFFSFITFGFYTFYWLYKTSGQIAALRKSLHLPADGVSKRTYTISFIALGVGSILIDTIIILLLFATAEILGEQSPLSTAELMGMFVNATYIVGEVLKVIFLVACLLLIALKSKDRTNPRLLHILVAIVLFRTYWIQILTICYLQASINDLIEHYPGNRTAKNLEGSEVSC